jgi:hypothetical protein
MKRFMIAAALFFTGTMATAHVAQAAPKWPKHPNLVAAWKALDKAWAKVDKAQDANDDQLGGHGAKAKGLIQAAEDDLKAARDSANANAGTGKGGDGDAAAACPKAFKFPKHPAMAAASKALVTACKKVTAAQKANEYDMDGHAAQAKADIIAAMGEILAARDFANTK